MSAASTRSLLLPARAPRRAKAAWLWHPARPWSPGRPPPQAPQRRLGRSTAALQTAPTRAVRGPAPAVACGAVQQRGSPATSRGRWPSATAALPAHARGARAAESTGWRTGPVSRRLWPLVPCCWPPRPRPPPLAPVLSGRPHYSAARPQQPPRLLQWLHWWCVRSSGPGCAGAAAMVATPQLRWPGAALRFQAAHRPPKTSAAPARKPVAWLTAMCLQSAAQGCAAWRHPAPKAASGRGAATGEQPVPPWLPAAVAGTRSAPCLAPAGPRGLCPRQPPPWSTPAWPS
mmetsp:Transcript_33964/g.107955  ORF Transcript_33964/g.107955 Transcript_33964/m.107955 type:complete len:288 (+) Transcript_33964:645-1508(+)